MALAVTVIGPALPVLSALASEKMPVARSVRPAPSADRMLAFTVTGPASPLAHVLLLICPVRSRRMLSMDTVTFPAAPPDPAQALDRTPVASLVMAPPSIVRDEFVPMPLT